MTVTALLTIHDKPPETVQAVLNGLQGQGCDQIVVVLDRPTPAIMDATGAFQGEILVLDGPPGWRSPCISANAGLARATGDLTVHTQGDVVHAPGNIDRIKAHFAAHPHSALFGRVTESNPQLCTGPGHAGPILQGTDNPRFMTYLMAAPTQDLRTIGGWDEAFQEGVWYEDDDLIARLWKLGLDFVIDDRISAIHLSHDRAYSKPIPIATNLALMLNKHHRPSSRAVVLASHPTISHHPHTTSFTHV